MISFSFTKKDNKYNFYVDKLVDEVLETKARINMTKVELRYAFELALEYVQARLDPFGSNIWDEMPKQEKRQGFGISLDNTKIYRTTFNKTMSQELISEDLSRYSIIDFSIFNYDAFSKEFI